MELLNWLKKPLSWWIGMALTVAGTILMRGVDGCSYCVELGGAIVFIGLAIVLFFGKVKT